MNILLVSLLGCFVVALPSAGAQKVKWCVKSQNELKKCQHLHTKSPELECHLKSSVTECMISIKNGEADAITADGQHIYRAGLLPFDLHPVIVEKSKKRCCYAVAVVKNDADFTINDLKGKTSCHSCYQSPGGWNIPIGRLLAQNKIPWDGPDDMTLEKAVSQFFSSSCIPGISKAQYPNLCQACQGDCSCSQNEKYYGDKGALQCLKNGHGQVAFVCQDAIPPSERQNYQLLCMNGSRKSVEEYKDCYLAKEPLRAVIGRKDADSQQIYKVLKQILDSDLFSSAAFGGKDLMFSDSACKLVELAENTDSFIYLREDYYEAMRALRGNMPAQTQDHQIQWCTISHAEQQKCDKISSQIPRIECQRASSVEECIKKIKSRKVDVITVDGGHVYIAGKCGLVPVMVEQYNQQSCDAVAGGGHQEPVTCHYMTDRHEQFDLKISKLKLMKNERHLDHLICPWGGPGRKSLGTTGLEASNYYVVAVVHKASGVTWNNLQGKKSCHTGLNTDAGWIVPGSAICDKTPDCTLTLYNCFSKGCAPGADPKSNMCELCKGSGKALGDESKCKASSAEMYYGYDGAFRCLAEKTGEVAFIKHTTVGDYTDGKGPDWAKNLKSDDFELICPESPDRSVKHTDFVNCNLAMVPAHAVVTREDARADVVNALKQAQANSEVQLFKSEGQRNLLFSDSTKCLQEITKPLEEFLGKKYIDMIERTYKAGQGPPDLVKACTYVGCPGPEPCPTTPTPTKIFDSLTHITHILQ